MYATRPPTASAWAPLYTDESDESQAFEQTSTAKLSRDGAREMNARRTKGAMRMRWRAAGVGWMEAGSSSDAGAHDVCVRSGERDEQWRGSERTRASGRRLSLRGRDVLTAAGHESPPRLNTQQHNRNRNNSTTPRVVDETTSAPRRRVMVQLAERGS